MLMTLIAGLTGAVWAETTDADAQIEKAAQRFVEGEEKNAEEMSAEMQALQQATEKAAERVQKALSPMAKKMAERAKAEAPGIIDAAAEQRRASVKMLTGALSAFRKAVDEVAK